MRRREFIALFGSTAVWPITAHAQQPEQVRRIGILMNRGAANPEGRAGIEAFRQGLQQLGWSDGRNVQMEIRWGENDIDRDRRDAAELVALAPDIIMASGPERSGVATCQPHHADRVRVRLRSCWCRTRRYLSAAGRQHHRLHAV